jgi:hypothetical protein
MKLIGPFCNYVNVPKKGLEDQNHILLSMYNKVSTFVIRWTNKTVMNVTAKCLFGSKNSWNARYK